MDALEREPSTLRFLDRQLPTALPTAPPSPLLIGQNGEPKPWFTGGDHIMIPFGTYSYKNTICLERLSLQSMCSLFFLFILISSITLSC